MRKSISYKSKVCCFMAAVIMSLAFLFVNGCGNLCFLHSNSRLIDRIPLASRLCLLFSGILLLPGILLLSVCRLILFSGILFLSVCRLILFSGILLLSMRTADTGGKPGEFCQSVGNWNGGSKGSGPETCRTDG